MFLYSLDARLTDLRETVGKGYWQERICAELAYALQLSRVREDRYDALLHSVVSFLEERRAAQGAVVKADVAEAEEMMRDLSAEAKRFTMVCAAHAHIDMNWMWRWDETVAVTLDTFRTMLDLLREYPDFTFSQSQASTYRIVEEYAPEMLDEIRERVREGRWEVTASTWVEPDKNMPNGESLARHILYTKRYLEGLLGIDPGTLSIDFEPDTFGHSANVPEILSAGGVRYYYHCRGYDGHHAYRWVAPSGASVLSYREPIWYNAEIQPGMAAYVPGFCTQHGLDTMLKVYGVGDHGGGPTRRDIQRIVDMNGWPIYPELRFGTFREFFALLEAAAVGLPEVHGELNSVFTGCYTTQTRIKRANRVAEATLLEAELFAAAAAQDGGAPYRHASFEQAWRNVLFNQFHDIIPGSGVIDTREYAMGLFQNTMALANTSRSLALRTLVQGRTQGAPAAAEAVLAQTSAGSAAPAAAQNAMVAPGGGGTGQTVPGSTSEGAGVGFGIQGFKVSQTERGSGPVRRFHVFNAGLFARNEPAELIVWDWPVNLQQLRVVDGHGQAVLHQVMDQGRHAYWGHEYIRILIQARVPACGYSTYTVSGGGEQPVPLAFPADQRVERPESFVLENEFVRIELDPLSGAIASLVDRATGAELIRQGAGSGGVFRLIREDDSKGMTAWTVGRHMSVQDLAAGVRLKKSDSGAVRQSVVMEATLGQSRVRAVLSLDYDSPTLHMDVECHWREIGERGKGIPQLAFYLPTAYECGAFRYDVPFGVVERGAAPLDVPANSVACAVRDGEQGPSLFIASDSKYGFRGVDNALSLTLIRSSFDPDPYPEFGVHSFRVSIGVLDCAREGRGGLVERGFRAAHPLGAFAAGRVDEASLAERSLLQIEQGRAALSAVKMPEDGRPGWIVRLYEVEGTGGEVVLRAPRALRRAVAVDLLEQEMAGPTVVVDEAGRVRFELAAHKVVSLLLEFATTG